MGITRPTRFRALALLTAGLVVGGLVTTVEVARADTAPQPGVEGTVSTDPLPTVQIDGVVWDQVVVGNTVYVGGSFTTARPAGSASGVNTVPRTNLLAYDLTTGALIGSFNHTLNGQVFTVAASPDGSRLYVGGQFTQVDGVTRNRIAAFSTANGALISSFNPGANTVVDSIAATATTVYVGGNFTNFAGSARIRAAAVSASDGRLLPFAPVADGGRVRAIVVSPDQSKVVLGGNFTTLNGQGEPGYGLGAVDAVTGASLPWNANGIIRNAGPEASIYSLDSDGDSVYGSGYHFGEGGTLEGAFRADWANGDIVWVEDCHGDTYSVSASSDVVYTATHAHYCGNVGGFPQTEPNWTIQRGMAWSKSLSGSVATPDPHGYYSFTGTPAPKLLNFWPDINVGTFTGANQGAWDVTATEDYVLYAGEFTRVNNKPQQGIVRFAKPNIAPNDDGPRLSGAAFVPSVVSLASGTARISWQANYDRDNQYLKYDVIRNGVNSAPVHTTTVGSRIWFDRPVSSYTDTGLTPGQTYTYRLRATDPFGNVAYGNPVSVTITAEGSISPYAKDVVDSGATSYWRLGEGSGADVYDWAGISDAKAGTGVTRGVGGAIADDTNTAAQFSGADGGHVATQTAIQGPDSFAVEAWFRTSSTTGGKIVGFGNARTGTSSSYDRHVYMDPDGRVLFGVYPGEARVTQSAPGLNDGQWHHVVANLGASGMQLYIDGARVDQRTDTTFGQAYSGYWRIGGDSSWSGNPYFAGAIDDVAVYSEPLTVQEINRHVVLSGRTSTLPPAPADAYGAAVVGDSPDIFWRLDEKEGSVAVDTSDGQDAGTYSGGVNLGSSGAIASTSNTAAAFDGADGLLSSSRRYTNPQTYSVEAWFRTDTTRGGKIIGFGSERSETSGSYDRHVYLTDDGQLVFGTFTGELNTITTTDRYNDSEWHQVVATQSSAGLRLYVDGELEGTHPATGAEPYDGYWRVGGDMTWGSSSSYVRGLIDEVSVYSVALSAAAVNDHYRLGAGRAPNRAPSAAFTSTVTDLSVSVDASSATDADGTIAGYAWDFGDGTSDSGPTAAHTYASAGTYSVTLTVTDDTGATGSLTRAVTAVAPNTAPTAAFTTSMSDLGLTVDASGSTDRDGTVTSYAWQFGDGGTATGATVTHAYARPGTYTVTLTVTDDDGATTVRNAEVTASAPPPANVAPVAAFTATSSGLIVAFDGSGSADTDGGIASYAWSYGDGATGAGANPSHTYGTGGTYTVTLTVTDDDGASATTTRSVSITAPPPSAPIAEDSFSRTTGTGLGTAPTGGAWSTSGTTSNFAVDGSAAKFRSTVKGANQLAYLTGATAADTEVRVTAALEQASSGGGTYVSVIGRRVGTSDYRARAVISATGTTSLQIQRNGTTLQAVSVPGTYAVGDVLQFRLQTVGTSPTTVRAKLWKAGSTEPAAWQVSATDSTAGLQAAGHIGLGTYVSGSSTVLPLTVSFDNLWAGSPAAGAAPTQPTQPTQPAANAAPTAAFTASATDLTAAFDGAGSTDSDGSITNWAWNFGNGASGTGRTASHAYTAPGSYTVTLTVTDDDGATSSASRQITVTVSAPPPAPTAAIAADAFSRNSGSGWASADVGGAWTTSTASSFSVADGVGRVRSTTAGALHQAFLAGVSSASSDTTASFALEQAPSGGGTFVSVIGRRVGTQDYRARAVVNSTGAVNLQLQRNGTTIQAVAVSGLTHSLGDKLNVRLQVTGTAPTTLRAKVWKAGTPEPAAWQVQATDATAELQAAGAVGLGTYIAGSASVLPLTVAFDDFAVMEVR